MLSLFTIASQPYLLSMEQEPEETEALEMKLEKMARIGNLRELRAFLPLINDPVEGIPENLMSITLKAAIQNRQIGCVKWITKTFKDQISSSLAITLAQEVIKNYHLGIITCLCELFSLQVVNEEGEEEPKLKVERVLTANHIPPNFPLDCFMHHIIPFIAGSNPENSLAWAAGNNCLVKKFSNEFRLSGSAPITNAIEPLTAAAQAGSPAALKYIAQRFPDQITNANSILNAAVANNDLKMVKNIVVNLGDKITSANQALEIAAGAGFVKMVRYILRSLKGKITNPTKAIEQSGARQHLKIARYLLRVLSNKTNVNHLLLNAVETNNLPMVRTITSCRNTGITMLMPALRKAVEGGCSQRE